MRGHHPYTFKAARFFAPAQLASLAVRILHPTHKSLSSSLRDLFELVDLLRC